MVSNYKKTATNLGCLLPDVSLSAQLASTSITGLTIDSRVVEPGYLFVAMAGLQIHGKAFIPQALANGAAAILIDAKEFDANFASSKITKVPVIAVDNLEQELSAIAGRFYGDSSLGMPTIAITGTNGKTTCSQLLAQALTYLEQPCGVLGTLGYGLVQKKNDLVLAELTDTGMTTPDAISTQAICAELKKQGAKTIALEVSSHAMVQHRVAALAINTAVFTNLTHDHLDYHGSMEAYGAAKAALFSMPTISSAVINQDDGFAENIISAIRKDCRLVTFGLNTKVTTACEGREHFTLANIHPDAEGMTAELVSPEGNFTLSTKLLGHFNLSNLLAVIACLYVHDFSLADILKVVPLLESVPGRMELVANQLGFQVVVDFAHTPDALEKSLQALAPHTQGDLWCVFGCGGDRDREKRPLMAAVAEGLADKIIVTSDNPRRESAVQIFADIEQGFKQPREVIADRASAIEFALSEAKAGDVVLIAGKGHEDYQLIGDKHFPFSDQHQARFCLRQRESLESPNA